MPGKKGMRKMKKSPKIGMRGGGMVKKPRGMRGGGMVKKSK